MSKRKSYMQIVCPHCLKLQSNIKHCAECGKRLTKPTQTNNSKENKKG